MDELDYFVRGTAMKRLLRGMLMAAVFVTPMTALGQQIASSQEASAARSKDGKKLFGTAEALRLARVSSPRISPDGLRVAYLVSENVIDKEKDGAWKSVTQLWV